MTVLILATERDISVDRMVRALGDRDVSVFRADLSWFPQQLTLGGVLGALPVRWVNHPSRHADAGYKPRQLVAAVRAGLSVVPTLVTNDAVAVRRFAARCGPDGVVTKMFGASAIFEQGGRRATLTRRLTAVDIDDLRGVEVTAHQIQRWAPKREEARVIVIGQHVFAVAIRAGSDAAYIDWRADYHNLSYEQIALPTTVEQGIHAVMSELDLVYGAFDFVITPDDEWIFLEVNPGGQFGFLEDPTDAPLTATLADLLAQEAP